MANHFIKSNKPYIPGEYQSVNDYVNGKTDAYFNTLEIDNPILQASGFLTNKLVNFVFTSLPLETLTVKERQDAMIANVDIINRKTAAVNSKYKVHLLYTLWAQASASDYNTTSDYLNSVTSKRFGWLRRGSTSLPELELGDWTDRMEERFQKICAKTMARFGYR